MMKAILPNLAGSKHSRTIFALLALYDIFCCLGLMLSAGEIPRIAGAFGLDTTTRANIMSAVYTAQAAVNTTRTIVQAVSK